MIVDLNENLCYSGPNLVGYHLVRAGRGVSLLQLYDVAQQSDKVMFTKISIFLHTTNIFVLGHAERGA
jgi:hypothetical protein